MDALRKRNNGLDASKLIPLPVALRFLARGLQPYTDQPWRDLSKEGHIRADRRGEPGFSPIVWNAGGDRAGNRRDFKHNSASNSPLFPASNDSDPGI